MAESGPRDNAFIPEPSDALEFEPVAPPPPVRRFGFLFILSALTVLALAAAAGWYFLGAGLLVSEEPGIPLIRAEPGPVKVRPDNPGGLDVPNRDKLVYERMRGGNLEGRVERLLPRPEAPLAPPKRKTAPPAAADRALPPPRRIAGNQKPPKKVTAVVPSAADVNKVKPPTPAPPPPESATPTQSFKPLKKAGPVKKAAKEKAPAAKAPEPAQKAKAVEKKEIKSRPKAGYRIQLAAVRSPERAKQEWARLTKKHSDLLGGFGLTVVKADLGPKKGIFYRLRAGPVPSEEAARKLCTLLAKRKVGCLIVRPDG